MRTALLVIERLVPCGPVAAKRRLIEAEMQAEAMEKHLADSRRAHSVSVTSHWQGSGIEKWTLTVFDLGEFATMKYMHF